MQLDLVHGKYTLRDLMQKIRRLGTVRQIVEVYDDAHGAGAFRRFLGCTKQSIYNYKKGNFLPPDTHHIVTQELASLNCSAPPSLFRQREAKRSRVAA